ncbi:MAG: hypothetical protein F4215_00400 [Gemmatimonadetes bacterium]|nr:hypothetical protein [Gemmatimonadota bacterium]
MICVSPFYRLSSTARSCRTPFSMSSGDPSVRCSHCPYNRLIGPF